MITEDEILGLGFLIDGRLFKGDRSSIKNKQFCDHRGWKIGLIFFDRWEIGKG